MGKTSAPLTFLTSADFYAKHQVEFDDLVSKGHSLQVIGDDMFPNTPPFDIGLDPRMWRTWTDPTTGRIANLDMAIKSARVAKKLREKKK